jgi:membrane-bound lytic murein transglycosylase A
VRRLTPAEAVVALALAGCVATAPPAAAPGAGLVRMAQLPGWEAEDHVGALALVRRACQDQPAPPAWCAAALATGRLGEPGAKAFLERRFRAAPIVGEGLLTAYFAPTYDARRARDPTFSAPVRPRPPDPASAPDRGGIEAGPAPDALAWMRPEDLFFLRIQGSGTLRFPEGERARAVFAGSTGRPFVAIAGPMAERGLIPATATATDVHDWLATHRGPDADAVMRLDPRYVFLKLAPDDGTEPRGSSGAELFAGRSIAVDPATHPAFELMWIDADAPTLPGARPDYRRLAAAMDTGGAIKGEVRADLYLGRGEAAGREAGAVRHKLRLFRIVAVPEDAR